MVVGVRTGEQDGGGSDVSQMSPLVENILRGVREKVSFTNETLDQMNDAALMSRLLAAMNDLDRGTLKPFREAGVLTFDFHPPVEIPVHTEKAINTIQDEEFAFALTLIGSHVGELFIKNHQQLATQAQVVSNMLTGAELIRPAVVDMSIIGRIFFMLLDDFDSKAGAVVNGKAMGTVRAIDISASGPSFHWVRPKIVRSDRMTNILTLTEIDDWRRSRLATAGVMAREASLSRETVQEIMKGIRLDPIFP